MQSLEVISVNLWNILISLLNLLILFLLFKKFLFGPVNKMLAKRQSEIDEKYEAADEAKRLAQEDKLLWDEKIGTVQAESEALIKKAKLVIFDDIGIKDLTEFEKQLFYIWVEYRTSNKKSSIYTSNIYPENFASIFGPRISDRIIGYSTIIEIKGQSRRNDVNFLEVIKQ